MLCVGVWHKKKNNNNKHNLPSKPGLMDTCSGNAVRFNGRRASEAVDNNNQ